MKNQITLDGILQRGFIELQAQGPKILLAKSRKIPRKQRAYPYNKNYLVAILNEQGNIYTVVGYDD